MKGKNKSILSTDVPGPTSHELTLVTCISLGVDLCSSPPTTYSSFLSSPSPSSSSLHLSVECRMSSIILPSKISKSSHECETGHNYNHHASLKLLRKMIMERNKARLFKEMSKTYWETVLTNTKWVRIKQCGKGSNKRLSPHFPLISLVIIFEWVWVVFLLGGWQSSVCSMILRVQLHLLLQSHFLLALFLGL